MREKLLNTWSQISVSKYINPSFKYNNINCHAEQCWRLKNLVLIYCKKISKKAFMTSVCEYKKKNNYIIACRRRKNRLLPLSSLLVIELDIVCGLTAHSIRKVFIGISFFFDNLMRTIRDICQWIKYVYVKNFFTRTSHTNTN